MSKRDLYKNVTKNVGDTKSKRKPLPQGVLDAPEQSAHGVLDPMINPIQVVPQQRDNLPIASPPSKLLDLSDAESDSELPKPILVYDATHLSVSSDGTAVDVMLGYEASPGKVIRHVPVNSAAAKVSGQQNLTDQLSMSQGSSEFQLSFARSPRPGNDTGGRKLTFLEHLSSLPVSNFEGGTSVSDTSLVQTVSTLQPAMGDASSIPMDESPRSLGAAQNKSQLNSSEFQAEVSSQPKPGKKKGKARRVVPSRYMQSAFNKTVSMGNITANNSSGLRAPDKPPNQRATRTETSQPKIVDRKTSTPTMEEKSHYLDDISAIQSASTMSFCLESNPADSTHTGAIPKVVVRKTDGKVKKHPKKGKTDEISKMELDFAYTQYLQWSFLNAKAAKAIKEQDAKAIKEVNGLFLLLESQREKLADCQSEVAHLKRELLVEDILLKSEAEVQKLASILPQLQDNFSTMTSALSTTLHQLPVKDIVTSQSDSEREKLENEMVSNLKGSAKLLGAINDLVEDRLEGLGEYVQCLNAIDSSYSQNCSELQALQGGMDEMNTLTTKVSSLIVQDLQHSDE